MVRVVLVKDLVTIVIGNPERLDKCGVDAVKDRLAVGARTAARDVDVDDGHARTCTKSAGGREVVASLRDPTASYLRQRPASTNE